jgi:predicted aspartyl protease
MDYTLEDGLIFVGVRINGEKGRALIDTGSNLSYVNSAFARLAGMGRNEQRTKVLLGATGDSAPVWIGRAREIKLGGFSVDRFNVLVSDPVLLDEIGLRDEPVMVIGLDVLTQFRVQIDRKRQRFVLAMPAADLGGLRMGPSVSGSRLRD